jgi:hypothetical protein
MIGPFSSGTGAEILFRLYVPKYIPAAIPALAPNKLDSSFAEIFVENREMPLSVSRPLRDICLVELEQEDSYNGYVPSFSFEDRDSLARWRRNYAEAAFALGQRAKYIFLHAYVPLKGMSIIEYIGRLEDIDPFVIYPSVPWELDENGDLVYTDLGT